YEVGEHDGLPYLALEFCPGGRLDKKLHGAPLLPREAAALVEKLPLAMQGAQGKGVIHRGLKSAEVLPSWDCTPQSTGVGLALQLEEAAQPRSGASMGTPSSRAPEQAAGKGKEIGPAADVDALGAILYELLTGRNPFLGPTPLDTILQVLSDDPRPPWRL